VKVKKSYLFTYVKEPQNFLFFYCKLVPLPLLQNYIHLRKNRFSMGALRGDLCCRRKT